MIEVLFCDECESFFETTEDMAATIRYMQSDYECYGDVTVRCNPCEQKAMVAEQETDFAGRNALLQLRKQSHRRGRRTRRPLLSLYRR